MCEEVFYGFRAIPLLLDMNADSERGANSHDDKGFVMHQNQENVFLFVYHDDFPDISCTLCSDKESLLPFSLVEIRVSTEKFTCEPGRISKSLGR